MYFADAFGKTTGKYRTYEHIFGGEIPYLVASAVVASSLLVSLSICPCPPLGAEETFLRTRERCLTPIGTISGCSDISESTALEKKETRISQLNSKQNKELGMSHLNSGSRAERHLFFRAEWIFFSSFCVKKNESENN